MRKWKRKNKCLLAIALPVLAAQIFMEMLCPKLSLNHTWITIVLLLDIAIICCILLVFLKNSSKKNERKK